MKLLVTGGLGFIGSNFILQVLKNNSDFSVTNIDAELTGSDHHNLDELKNSSNYCLTISDEAISTTVALLAEKRLSDEKIIAGECAVPGVIALIGSFNNKEYLDKLELNEQSNVLLFGCEGLTDNAMYQKLLSDGLQKI